MMSLPEFDREQVWRQLQPAYESASGVHYPGTEGFGTLMASQVSIEDLGGTAPWLPLWKIACCQYEEWEYKTWSQEEAESITDNVYRSEHLRYLDTQSTDSPHRVAECLPDSARSVLDLQNGILPAGFSNYWPKPQAPRFLLNSGHHLKLPRPLDSFGDPQMVLADAWNNLEILSKTEKEWRLVNWYTLA